MIFKPSRSVYIGSKSIRKINLFPSLQSPFDTDKPIVMVKPQLQISTSTNGPIACILLLHCQEPPPKAKDQAKAHKIWLDSPVDGRLTGV